MKFLSALVLVMLLNACSEFRPMTYQLWANQLDAPKNDLIDITALSDDQIESLRNQNPNAKFYYTTTDKRFMEQIGTSNKYGFTTKVFLTPLTLVIDGVVITVYAALEEMDRSR